MITIGSNNLSVELIDPNDEADRAKLGSRYCTGGYIWQIYDGSRGICLDVFECGRNGRTPGMGVCAAPGTGGRGRPPLLAGPHYPSISPPPFDGQGMPEVFETPLGGGDDPVGSDVCVIGVGLVKKTSAIAPFHPRNNPRVIKFCDWETERGDDWAVMTTGQNFKDKSIKLKREVRVNGNRVNSITTVNNIGNDDVTLRWFSHPFFPLNPELTCGKASRPVSFPDNAGYYLEDDGTIRMKPDYPWEKGLFQALDVPPERLTFAIPHPVAGQINLSTDYNVIRCALWANANTFSFEPFMQRVVIPGGEASWGVEIFS